jgi:hypothetical protein
MHSTICSTLTRSGSGQLKISLPRYPRDHCFTTRAARIQLRTTPIPENSCRNTVLRRTHVLDPSWTITHGAIQTTNIHDLETTAVGIGSGKLPSPDSYKKMVSTEPRGKTHAQSDCPTTCFEQNDGYTYGLGIVISGDWLMQNPMMAGYAAVEAYLPAQKAAVAVAVTYAPDAFDGQGNYSNQADILFRKIGAVVAPNNAPPMPPGR